MKSIQFRSTPTWLCAAGALLALGLLTGPAAAVFWIPEPLSIPLALGLGIGYTGLFLIPGIWLLWWCRKAYRTVVVVSEWGVTLFSGKRQQKAFPWEKISVYGCISFLPRDGSIFFGTMEIDEVYLKRNLAGAKITYGKLYPAGIQTESGRLSMAVGNDLNGRCTSREADLIVLRSGSLSQLRKIQEFTEKAPVLTGGLLLQSSIEGRL